MILPAGRYLKCFSRWASPRDTIAVTVRLATEAGYEEVTTLLARAFAIDPMMNWCGGVKKETAVTNLDKLDAGMKETMENRYWFQRFAIHATLNAGGIITREGAQIITAVLWTTPGQKYDLSFNTFILGFDGMGDTGIQGQVDEAGHVAKSDEATGYPHWAMTKYSDMVPAELLVNAENF
ncbi:hypothetical protein IW261DRAFT_1419537 [Armillaria novae-zelandiae]|uniref:Uncharacterized protein n=1 Tax=Armillaria novae-zelandiae TaxID=153914 RepID=A0AA39P9Y5_9AGAR|nr:hypothetical protein IW261DRAFT_1419537 [Armillaria novae-zelandiae]